MKRRGYTLIELAALLAGFGLIAGLGGALYLEGRVAAARLEAQLSLEREASLAAEVLGRALREAREVYFEEGSLVARGAGGHTERYLLEAPRLWLEVDDQRRPVVLDLVRFRVRAFPPRPRFWVELEFEKLGAIGRPVRLERNFWVDRR